MKSCEPLIHPDSTFFTYTPSAVAKQMLLYPIVLGRFHYLPGYRLNRGPYDSILILAVLSGEMTFSVDGNDVVAKAGQIVLLDCFHAQSYYSNTQTNTIWIHINGNAVMNYYSQIVSVLGNVFSPSSFHSCCDELNTLISLFSDQSTVNETYMSLRIASLLMNFMMQSDKVTNDANDSVSSKTKLFISMHLTDNLSINNLARNVSLSPYHFLRCFKEETGITPHAYILSVRLDTAKYLLSSTHMSIHEITESSGFTNESIFCQAFKKAVGMSPGGYRKSLI